MQQIKFEKRDLFRFVPMLVFLLNCHALEPLAHFLGWGYAAIIGGINAVVIGLATMKWSRLYMPDLKPWEMKWLKIGGVISSAFGVMLSAIGFLSLS